ncbi:MAG: aryl-sulfate sulfotransferase [Planctomycetes bacterium]|nr:aryl-sulfate sulfotransferase [Planctomycetota bacterium]
MECNRAAAACLSALSCTLLIGQSPLGSSLYFVDPSGTNTGFLIDSAGQTVHSWTFNTAPSLASYMTPDGTVLRTYHNGATGPGVGGAVQRLALDGTVLWDYTPPGPGFQHHDIEEMPNGNVLIAMTDPLTSQEIIALGRDPAHVTATWNSERIIEVQPTGPTSGVVVWEWRAIDHLVQHFDPAAPDYDVVANRPERIDANYPTAPASALWMHINSIDYNPALDQVLVSCRNWSEFWILDHSTTTAEAAGSTGGLRGKGGDLLYRWGNPEAWSMTGTQYLAFQHDVTWIKPGLPGAGHLLCFDNRRGDLLGILQASSVVEIETPVDAFGDYPTPQGAPHLPAAPFWEYLPTGTEQIFSSVQSSAERLPNGNTLINSAADGRLFEIDSAGTVVWETPVPVTFKIRRITRTIWSDRDGVSTAAGGTAHFDLIAGSQLAGGAYFVGGSMSGTSPGFQIGSVHVPLNIDEYLGLATGSVVLPGSIGLLDASGRATASFVLPPVVAIPLAGMVLHHSCLVLDPTSIDIRLVAEPVPLLLLP